MAAHPAVQGSFCHERSASLQVSGSACCLAAADMLSSAAWGRTETVLMRLQDGRPSVTTASISYSHAHGRLQTDAEAVSTVTVAVQGSIDPYRFNMFMSDLLAERGSDIKQMHGILSIQVGPCMCCPRGLRQVYCMINHSAIDLGQ